ncbi:MAG: hypothetical protein E6778_18355 [Niallia nealsonii]|nr:hypothetical protein [Niallia nealsonii]
MTKTKWILAFLVAMDITLIIMYLTGYYFIFLLPTGYIIPITLNILVLSIFGFRSSRIRSFWVIIGLMVSIPILLLHALMVLLAENDYTIIDSPDNMQSLVIEHRHFTLGETIYSYQFYKTKFGLVGKYLDDQSIRIMVNFYDGGGMEDENALGWKNAQWIMKDIVRFSTFDGVKDVYLNSSSTKITKIDDLQGKEENNSLPSVSTEEIESFRKMAEKKEDGQAIEINGNRLEVRYDKLANESWIDVMNDNELGAIPRQQCSRIVRNEESGYYMLEECTHRWEYQLYPLRADE